jgi:hypothetical protein
MCLCLMTPSINSVTLKIWQVKCIEMIPLLQIQWEKKRGNKLTEAEAHKMHVSLILSFVVIDKKMLNKVIPDLV